MKNITYLLFIYLCSPLELYSDNAWEKEISAVHKYEVAISKKLLHKFKNHEPFILIYNEHNILRNHLVNLNRSFAFEHIKNLSELEYSVWQIKHPNLKKQLEKSPTYITLQYQLGVLKSYVSKYLLKNKVFATKLHKFEKQSRTIYLNNIQNELSSIIQLKNSKKPYNKAMKQMGESPNVE